MARKTISIKTINGDVLFGYAWEAENPVGTFFISEGMEECLYRYDEFATFLSDHGISVYGIDYYGQGENVLDERDLGVVPRSFFSKTVRILDDLVKKYRIKGKPVTVFGHSMGSFIVQDYIQRYSTHANKAIMMGTNGPNAKLAYNFGYPLARFVSKVRGETKEAKFLKSLAIGRFAKAVKNRKTDCDWLSYNEENVKKYIEDLKCGHPSTNGFYRELLKGNHRLYKSKFLKKISPDIEILITGGKDDPVGAMSKGPKSLAKLYQKLGLTKVELNIYEGMRHEILNENNKQKVYEDMLKFITK